MSHYKYIFTDSLRSLMIGKLEESLLNIPGGKGIFQVKFFPQCKD